MNNKKRLALIAAFPLAALMYFVLEDTGSVKQEGINFPQAASASTSASPGLSKPHTNTPIVSSKIIAPATTPTQNTEQLAQTQTEPEVLSPIERIKAIQNKTALHEALLDDHKSFTRYPEFNTRFEETEKDPSLERYAIDERTTENPDDRTALTLWTDHKYYLHGDEVTVFAELRDAHGAVVPTQFAGQLIFNERDSLRELSFLDHNSDGIHEASFKLTNTEATALQAGVYKVLVVNQFNELADAVTFTLSEPNLSLSGEFRDKLVDGDLVIETQVDVKEKGRFYLQASLYSEVDTPVGNTQTSVELEPGKHWVNLTFNGIMIRDAEEAGTFTLKNISLAKVALPIQRAPLIVEGFTTKAYDMEQFRQAPFVAAN